MNPPRTSPALWLLAAVLLASLPLHADPIGRRQAARLASHFMSRRGLGHRLLTPLPATGDSASLHVFNAEGGRGFVVVGGDDSRGPAILAYADSGSIGTENQALPPALRWWMQQAAGQAAAASPPTTDRQPVAPMLMTAWGQRAPYNDLCPMDGSSRSLTGCIATSMAQIMAFHRHPTLPTDSVPAYTTRTTGTLIEALPPTTLQWHQMLPTYDAAQHPTDAQQQAVATLMRYCGQAVGMDYRATLSGAYTAEAAEALHARFGYDDGVRQVVRSRYTILQWDSLIYGELAAGRPVLYAGQGASGAHAFVVDGCDADGLYHIDWGWTGDCNGYFYLHFLKPNENNYSANCAAVVGIQPPDSVPQLPEVPCLSGRSLTASGLTVKVAAINLGTRAHTFTTALALMQADGTVARAYGQRTYDYDAKYGRNLTYSVAQFGLPAGTSRLVPVCRADGDAVWQPIFSTDDYIEACMQRVDSVTLIVHPRHGLLLTDYTAEGQLLPFQTVRLTARLLNQGEDFLGDVTFMATAADGDDEPRQLGQALLCMGHGQSSQATVECLFSQPGDHQVQLLADGQVAGTMHITIGRDVQATVLGISGPCYTGCPVQASVALICPSTPFSGSIFLWPGQRPAIELGPVQLQPGDSTVLRGTLSFADAGLQQLTVTASHHREHQVAPPFFADVKPFVETEGLLRLEEPLALQADTLVVARVRNEAETDYVGYLFLMLSAADGSPIGEVPLLVALPAGHATQVCFTLNGLSATGCLARLWCQDFGSATPYGTTHELTAQPQPLTTGISAPAATPGTQQWYTPAGRRATPRTKTIIIKNGRKKTCMGRMAFSFDIE